MSEETGSFFSLSVPHLLMIASTSTWMGLLSDSRWMMSKTKQNRLAQA